MDPEYRSPPGVANQELPLGEEEGANHGSGTRVAPFRTHETPTRGPERAQPDSGKRGRHEDKEQDADGRPLIACEGLWRPRCLRCRACGPRCIPWVPRESPNTAGDEGHTDQTGKQEKPKHELGRSKRYEPQQAGQCQRECSDEADPGVMLMLTDRGTNERQPKPHPPPGPAAAAVAALHHDHLRCPPRAAPRAPTAGNSRRSRSRGRPQQPDGIRWPYCTETPEPVPFPCCQPGHDVHCAAGGGAHQDRRCGWLLGTRRALNAWIVWPASVSRQAFTLRGEAARRLP